MSTTFGGLLAGHSDERHETFQHLQACHADAAARVASLLEALGGSQRELRAAHSAWGYAQREHGRPVNAENMKGALRQKLLTLLPPVPLVALWELVPENAQDLLRPYQAVCLPVVNVRKFVRALRFLGTITRNMASDFKKVCSEWQVTVRQKKRERLQQELQVDLCNACVQFLADRMDSVVSPAQEAGSALTTQREVSVSAVTDNRVAESSASCTLGDLLAGHTQENAKEFQYFKTLSLSPDIVTGVISLLEALSGTARELRAACTQWKILKREAGRDLTLEQLKVKFREKIVSMLPPMPLAVLLQRVPEEIKEQLSEYVDVFVAAIDVDKVAQLLSFLGTLQQQSEPDVVRVCATWGVAVREGNRLRPRQQLAAELRGACVRFLKEDTAATVPLQSTEASISASDSASMVVQAPVENVPDDAASLQPEDVRTLTTALAMVRQKHMARRTRVTGKKQAVSAIPVDLSEAIETLHNHGTLTWAERKPWMILGGCKERRKHEGKFVRPSNSLALWETERVLVERVRLQLQVDPECRAAYDGPELLTPRTLKSFAESLKEESTRCITPFGTDFRQVHLPTQWDGGSLGGKSRVRGFAMRLAFAGWASFAGHLEESL